MKLPDIYIYTPGMLVLDIHRNICECLLCFNIFSESATDVASVDRGEHPLGQKKGKSGNAAEII